MRVMVFVAVAMLFAAFRADAQQNIRRVAVVVGVGAYRTVPALANPPRDARAIAASLKRLGFDTTLVLDPDRAALEQAVRTLGEKSRTADAAVFFYAGHALEAGGRNFLIPVNAKLSSTRDLPFEAVDLDLVGQQVEGRARTVVVFMDACRNNPFAFSLTGGERGLRRGAGLAAPTADASGTLIAFATAPGRTAEDGAGEDSPFTTALLKHIEKPRLEVRAMLGLVRRDVREATEGKQIPWESSALEGEFYFNPAGASSVPTAQQSVQPPVQPTGAGTPAVISTDTARSGAGGMGVTAPPSRVPGAPVVAGRPGLVPPTPAGAAPQPMTQTVAGAGSAPTIDTARPEGRVRSSRCHVNPVNGVRRPGGADTVMQVASDGRGCAFRIWVRIVERVPFDSLVATQAPSNGSVSVNNNSQIVYTPRPGFIGEDHFVVTSMPQGSVRVRVIVKPPVVDAASG